MTYGWAILVLGIVLSLLFTSGIFTPSYLVSEECNLGPKILCNFVIYQDSGATKLAINATNGFGYKIKITGIDIYMPEEDKSFAIPTQEYIAESGGSFVIEGKIADYTAAKNSIKKLKSEIEYYSCADEVNPACDAAVANKHKLTGRIIGRVA